jgi:hypothetical protein
MGCLFAGLRWNPRLPSRVNRVVSASDIRRHLPLSAVIPRRLPSSAVIPEGSAFDVAGRFAFDVAGMSEPGFSGLVD